MAFDELREQLGEGVQYAKPTEDDLGRLRTFADPELLAEWTEKGFCHFANRNFWLVNPLEYSDAATDWSADPAAYIFARTGMGDLYVMESKSDATFYVHHGSVIRPASKIYLWIRMGSITKKYLRDVHDQKLVDAASKKLGPIAPDEMYTFEPALALGGTSAIENIAKVKIHPQLSFLRQQHGELYVPENPFK